MILVHLALRLHCLSVGNSVADWIVEADSRIANWIVSAAAAGAAVVGPRDWRSLPA